MAMFYVYVLQDKITKEIYIGFSKNLVSRIKDHKKENKNLVLVYYEAYCSERAARDRERRLKLYGQSLSSLKRRIKDCFF